MEMCDGLVVHCGSVQKTYSFKDIYKLIPPGCYEDDDVMDPFDPKTCPLCFLVQESIPNTEPLTVNLASNVDWPLVEWTCVDSDYAVWGSREDMAKHLAHLASPSVISRPRRGGKARVTRPFHVNVLLE